jgi:hypothetical protein
MHRRQFVLFSQKPRAVALRAFHVFLVVAVLGSFVLSIAKILYEPGQFQWDLKVYYTSPILYAQGLDPYTDFVFPPLYLVVFKVFSSLFTYDQFYWIFLFLKIASVAILLIIWKTWFLRETSFVIFAIFIWLGFYSTFLMDFQAGNVSSFETTLLFIAFLCFLIDRLVPFVLFVILAASFKLTPILFLLLLLLSSNKHKVWYFAVGCLGFLIFGLLTFVLFPDLTKRFIFEAMKRVSSGDLHWSSLGLINYFFWQYFERFDVRPSNAPTYTAIWPPSWTLVMLIYFVFAISILWISWRALCAVRTMNENSRNSRLFITLCSILVYTLTMPRMKDYAYMLAIPSILFAVERFEIKFPRWLLFVPLVLISPYGLQPSLFRIIGGAFWLYYPLLVAFFFWYLYLCEARRRSCESTSCSVAVTDDRVFDVVKSTSNLGSS